MFKKYIDYLKDNPDGYWFKRKLYGWGWTPATWQGWVVIGIFIVYVCYSAFALEFDPTQNMALFLVEIIVAIIILLLICYKKGEKPKWQWGPEKK